MKTKIIILDGFTVNPGDISWDALYDIAEVKYYDLTSNEPEDLDEKVKRIGDAQIVLTNKTYLTKEVMDRCPNLKYIGVLATGYNVVDIDYAREKGIIVTNIPIYGTKTVAQFTFALLLEICQNVGLHNSSVQNGEWENSKHFCYFKYPLMELSGKTMGIIGYGKIGQAVAKIAKGFDIKVIANTRTPKNDTDVEFVDLEELFRKSDIISLNCPLTKDNENLIRKENIDKMKDNVIIINTARGGLVNEQDTADALKSGKIKAMAVDVLCEEPPKDGSALINCKNCIVTPHIAWGTVEARTRLLNTAVSNIKGFLKGEVINNVT